MPLPRLVPALAALALLAPLPAQAEYLDPDWTDFTVDGIEEPDWLAGMRNGDYIGMCNTCDSTMMLQVQTGPDDGTGGRVHSGETTAKTYTQIGRANAEKFGNGAAYYGTEAIDFATAKGFKTSAKTAMGDYSSTYQLWDDGHQLIVRVLGADQAEVERIADKVYEAAAPLTFK